MDKTNLFNKVVFVLNIMASLWLLGLIGFGVFCNLPVFTIFFLTVWSGVTLIMAIAFNPFLQKRKYIKYI